jgi:membrane protein
MAHGGLHEALWRTVKDVNNKHTLQMAAALSYYFLISLFPGVILLAAIFVYLPGHDGLLNQAFLLMGDFIPKDAVAPLQKMVLDMISRNRSTLLSFGILGTLWTTSGGFGAIIEALNIAYEVDETRPFWRTRPLALGLALAIGLLLLVALGVMMVGPDFGRWLADRLHLSWLFALVWPSVHWLVAVGFAILAVEWLYYAAPNVKQRFFSTLPGAIVAVSSWIAFSYGLGVYFRHFAHFNRTYGALGAVVAPMIWLYWTGFFMLLGAELNCELAKESRLGKLSRKEKPTRLAKRDEAA